SWTPPSATAATRPPRCGRSAASTASCCSWRSSSSISASRSLVRPPREGQASERAARRARPARRVPRDAGGPRAGAGLRDHRVRRARGPRDGATGCRARARGRGESRGEAAAREAQSRVSLAGTDEDRVAKRRALTFVVVREPPVVWWRWEPAWTVVVARALRDVEARGALEGFARHGGRVVLVEDRLADAGFLAAYRGGEPGRPQPIGQGRVARVPSLGSAALDGLFAARMVTGQGEARWASWPYDRSEATWVGRRLARALVFPSLASV